MIMTNIESWSYPDQNENKKLSATEISQQASLNLAKVFSIIDNPTEQINNLSDWNEVNPTELQLAWIFKKTNAMKELQKNKDTSTLSVNKVMEAYDKYEATLQTA